MRPNIIYEQHQNHETTVSVRIAHARQSPFFCFVSNRAWDDVLRRAKSHPHELELQDDATGNTLLHEACRLDPPADVVRALLSGQVLVPNDLGATPLHIAASHRCSADALAVLLDCTDVTNKKEQQHPTTDVTHMGRAPIHYACMSFRGLDMEAFMMLLEATLKKGFVLASDEHQKPSLGFEDIDEELDDPYYFLERKDDERVWVNVMSMKDSQGHTPLASLFRRYRQRVRTVICTIDKLRSENENAPEQAALASAMTVHRELGVLWEKARRIVARLTEARLKQEGTVPNKALAQAPSPGTAAEQLSAAMWATEKHRGADLSEDDVLPVYVDVSDRDSIACPVKNRRFLIVHSSVGLIGYGCPPEMIRLAISIHPNQVREMDEEGNLPLHIAAKALSFLAYGPITPSAMAAAAAATARDHADDASLLSDAMSFFSSSTVAQTTNPFDKVIKILLQHYPEAAQTPNGMSGQLPLVLAIEAGHRTWDDGIRTLLNAYPPAMHNKKVIELQLYPNLLALVANGNADFGASFQLCSSLGGLRLPSTSGLTCKKRHNEQCNRNTLFEIIRAKPEWLTPEGRVVEHINSRR
jgi:ankyrin repeat protein